MAGAFTEPESVEGGLLGQTLNQVQGDGFLFRGTVQRPWVTGPEFRGAVVGRLF